LKLKFFKSLLKDIFDGGLDVFKIEDPMSLGPVSLTDTEGLTMIDNVVQGENTN